MQIIIIGSGTAIPHISRAAPATFIKFNDKTVLIDTGPGTLRRLKEANIDYLDIDCLIYTHFHPDHTLELPGFLFVYKNPENLRRKDLFIIAPVGFVEFLAKLSNLYGDWIKATSYKLEIKEVSETEVEIFGAKLITKFMCHTPNSLGYRIEYGNKSIAISGDTHYCDNILAMGAGVDLLILECSFPDSKSVEGHLCPATITKIVEKIKCKKLLLTHFYPIWDDYKLEEELKSIYETCSTKGIEVVIAKDFLEIKI